MYVPNDCRYAFYRCVYKTLNNNLNENGGSLEVIYTLDFNSDLVSENRFKIDIEKRKR